MTTTNHHHNNNYNYKPQLRTILPRAATLQDLGHCIEGCAAGGALFYTVAQVLQCGSTRRTDDDNDDNDANNHDNNADKMIMMMIMIMTMIIILKK